MNRLLFAIALAGFACGASAQSTGAGGSFSGQDSPTVVATLSQPAGGARSFNEALADAAANTPRTAPQTSGVTPAIPEPQTYALLLAGLGAVIFVAVRRRRP